MVDPSILESPVFKLIEKEFRNVIEECPTYVCDICWKFEFRTNVKKLKQSKYEKKSYTVYAILVNQNGYVAVVITH